MKVSEAWLREWVDLPQENSSLASQLTMAGLEVDHRSAVAGEFTRVVVARVQATMPHPQADRLTLCDVDAGFEQPLRVVCGATNVRPDLMVALALVGARLPGDLRIKESKLRGEISQGMLCSASELGLQDTSNGILELPQDAPIGEDIRVYLQLDDYVLDIDLTPNRADCLSVRGIARELSVLNRTPFIAREINAVAPTHDVVCTVHLDAPDACPAYAVRVLKGIDVHATTPLWMKERLRRAGQQSIHPVVDVLNYVMFELGQPMHAFDLAAVHGDIHVRMGQQGESLTLLNEHDVVLDEHIVVIADQQKPLAMAGVMGGSASGVHAATVDVVLESAFFKPLAIAGVARRFGLSSEASQRFERGVDPHLHVDALEYATSLLMTIVGGESGPITSVRTPGAFPSASNVLFRPARVASLTGVDIAEHEMLLILNGLGMHVQTTPEAWSVLVPSYRFDITLEVDLIEEILRIHGYDNLHAKPMIAPLIQGKTHPIAQRTSQISTFLSARGYHETISYSFVDPALQREIYPDASVMTLLNPISSELSEMRVGLWPGLIASLIHNVHRQQAVVKCFETGVIFDRTQGYLNECASVAGILSGESGALHWSELTRKYDFYDMKGDLQALFAHLQCPTDALSFVPATHAALHPGQTARILFHDEPVGWLGVLHPQLLDALGLTTDVVMFEFALKPFEHTTSVHYQRISKYPQIRRDLSLLMDLEVNVCDVERVVRCVVPAAQLKAFDVFDQYVGSTLLPGKKSVAIALTLQDDHRTLVDDEINRIISAILKELGEQLAIVLRD